MRCLFAFIFIWPMAGFQCWPTPSIVLLAAPLFEIQSLTPTHTGSSRISKLSRCDFLWFRSKSWSSFLLLPMLMVVSFKGHSHRTSIGCNFFCFIRFWFSRWFHFIPSFHFLLVHCCLFFFTNHLLAVSSTSYSWSRKAYNQMQRNKKRGEVGGDREKGASTSLAGPDGKA